MHTPRRLAVAPNRLLHGEGGIARPHGVVLMGDGGTKQRHDPVAHNLIDRALIAVHRVHHALEHRVEQCTRFLGVPVGQQFHGALEVGKEHGDLLALAFQGTAGGQDLLRQIGGRVGEGGRGLHRLGGGG
jgi:hypothetical protein